MQRRMSVSIREYKFFRSFSQKFENWPKRKAEALWRKMRERKIAGEHFQMIEQNVHSRRIPRAEIIKSELVSILREQAESTRAMYGRVPLAVYCFSTPN